LGDTLISIDGHTLNSAGDLSRYVQLNLGKKTEFIVIHADGTKETLTLVPRVRYQPGEGSVGILPENVNPVIVSESLPFWKAIPSGVVDVWQTLVLYKNGIIGMFIGTVPFTPSGPVGIVQVTGEVARSGVTPVLELAAVISIAVGVTQIIPFPALDGGRLFFILVEWIRRGKRVPPKVEMLIHNVGFIVLLALMVLITYQDIARWITGGSLLGG
jgi:regulator of sigma E protease